MFTSTNKPIAHRDPTYGCGVIRYRQHAPILNLPNEVLAMIFEEGHKLSPLLNRSGVRFEILVSHVTRHWRSIALSAPRLWSRIPISLLRSFDMTTCYLQRSRAAALDLLIIMDDDSECAGHLCQTLCQLLNPHARRWRRLWIHSNLGPCLDSLLDDLPRAAPLLETFYVFLDTLEGITMNLKDRFLFVDGAPSLTSVGLNGIGLFNCLLPLATVTDLRLDCLALSIHCDYDQFRELMDNLPALARLIVRGEIVTKWPQTAAPINLPALRCLHICTALGHHGQVSGLLSLTRAPDLETLVVETNDDQAFARFFAHMHSLSPTQKFPLLRVLTLHRQTVNAVSLSTWLVLTDIFPSVTHLTLFHHDPRNLLRCLQDSTKLRLPDLLSLTLANYTSGGDAWSKSGPSLTGVITQRVNRQRPIRRLNLQPELYLTSYIAELKGIGGIQLNPFVSNPHSELLHWDLMWTHYL